jgi:hypothetical protein
MDAKEHPEHEALLRFVRGEAEGAERRAVVRHLLTGCLDCVAVTRPYVLLAERWGGDPDLEEMPMGHVEEAARAELRKVMEDLDSLRYRLLGVRASIPASPLEAGPGREDDLPEESTDEATDLRSGIANVLNDRIDPALSDLDQMSRPRRAQGFRDA